ncbi:unnamed protein product [Heterobilharzia americana]|nr:unnamed protein product [Heterobilharzia americana]
MTTMCVYISTTHIGYQPCHHLHSPITGFSSTVDHQLPSLHHPVWLKPTVKLLHTSIDLTFYYGHLGSFPSLNLLQPTLCDDGNGNSPSHQCLHLTGLCHLRILRLTKILPQLRQHPCIHLTKDTPP